MQQTQSSTGRKPSSETVPLGSNGSFADHTYKAHLFRQPRDTLSTALADDRRHEARYQVGNLSEIRRSRKLFTACQAVVTSRRRQLKGSTTGNREDWPKWKFVTFDMELFSLSLLWPPRLREEDGREQVDCSISQRQEMNFLHYDPHVDTVEAGRHHNRDLWSSQTRRLHLREVEHLLTKGSISVATRASHVETKHEPIHPFRCPFDFRIREKLQRAEVLAS